MNRVKNSKIKNKDQFNINSLSNNSMTRMTVLGLLVLALGISAIPALAETEILSPFKQFNSGIPINEIQCNDSKILMESPRNTPACVNETSVDRLLQNGFYVIAITVDSTNMDVEEPDSTNMDVEEPDSTNMDVEEPDSTNMDVEEPDSTNMDVEEPDSTNMDVEEPDSTNMDVEEPDSTNMDVEEPDSTNMDVEEPDSTNMDVEEPDSTNMDVEEPDSTNMDVEEPDSTNMDVEEPDSTNGKLTVDNVNDEPQITVLNVSSPVEFVDDGQEVKRAMLQKSPAPHNVYERITNAIETGLTANEEDGIARIPTPVPHEKYSRHSDGFYPIDWMPTHIPDGQKLLYSETFCYETVVVCKLYLVFVPTTFVLNANVTNFDMDISKGFTVYVEYEASGQDEIEDVIEMLRENFESQSGNYAEFRDMTRDGKTIMAIEGGTDYNHYRASVSMNIDEYTAFGANSNYHTLDEMILVFDSLWN